VVARTVGDPTGPSGPLISSSRLAFPRECGRAAIRDFADQPMRSAERTRHASLPFQRRTRVRHLTLLRVSPPRRREYPESVISVDKSSITCAPTWPRHTGQRAPHGATRAEASPDGHTRIYTAVSHPRANSGSNHRVLKPITHTLIHSPNPRFHPNRSTDSAAVTPRPPAARSLPWTQATYNVARPHRARPQPVTRGQRRPSGRSLADQLVTSTPGAPARPTRTNLAHGSHAPPTRNPHHRKTAGSSTTNAQPATCRPWLPITHRPQCGPGRGSAGDTGSSHLSCEGSSISAHAKTGCIGLR